MFFSQIWICLYLSIPWNPLPLAEKDPLFATYSAGKITKSDFDNWWRFNRKKQDDDPYFALQELILQRLLAAEAVAQGLHDAVAEDVLINTTLGGWAKTKFAKELNRNITVPKEHIQKTFEISRHNQHRPRKVRLWNIYKRFPESYRESQKRTTLEAMNLLRERLINGESFAAIAMLESHSQTRFNRGILGNIRAGQLRREVDLVAMKMEPGTYSQPIVTSDGVTLLYCERIIPQVKRSDAEFKKIVTERLRERRYQAKLKKFMQQNANIDDLVFHWQALQGTNPPSVVAELGDLKLETRAYVALLRQNGLRWSERPPKRPQWIREYFEQILLLRKLATRSEYHAVLKAHPIFLRERSRAVAAMEQRIKRDITRPSESEIKQAYEQTKHTYQHPRMFHCQILQIPYQKGNLKKVHNQSFNLWTALKNNQLTFETAIAKYSHHTSKDKQGMLGWLTENQLATLGINLVRAAKFHKPNHMSGLIQENNAFWILKVHRKKPMRGMTLAEAQPSIEKVLGQRTVAQLEEAYSANLLAAANIITTAEFAKNKTLNHP